MSGAELSAWLETVQCTAPFTLEDMAALQQMVKQIVPNALVDVFDVDGYGKTIRVTAGGCTRDIPIT